MLRGLLSRGLAVAALMALVGVLGGLLAACGGASTSSGTTTEVFRDTTGDLSGFYWRISGPSGTVARAVHAVRTGKDKVAAHFIEGGRPSGLHHPDRAGHDSGLRPQRTRGCGLLPWPRREVTRVSSARADAAGLGQCFGNDPRRSGRASYP